jgi:hypothetical protein
MEEVEFERVGEDGLFVVVSVGGEGAVDMGFDEVRW